MTATWRPGLVVVASVLLAGCAIVGPLDIVYPDAVAGRGPLAVVERRHVVIGPFVDERAVKDGIGVRRDMFGYTSAIESTRPVADIVREALATEFRKNGHDVAAGDRGDVVLSGTITEFWFDVEQGWALDLMGEVAVTLEVADGRSGARLLTARYQGDSVEGGSGNMGAERVMNRALRRLVREVATDPRLIAVLATAR